MSNNTTAPGSTGCPLVWTFIDIQTRFILYFERPNRRRTPSVPRHMLAAHAKQDSASGWLVQAVLGIAAFTVLVYKRFHEKPMRPWIIWCRPRPAHPAVTWHRWYDSSKQGVAAVRARLHANGLTGAGADPLCQRAAGHRVEFQHARPRCMHVARTCLARALRSPIQVLY